MSSNDSANEAPRGRRELNNAETGGRNDIITIILANGASYDSKERVVLRRLALKIRVEVGKRQQGREPGRLNRPPASAHPGEAQLEVLANYRKSVDREMPSHSRVSASNANRSLPTYSKASGPNIK